MHETIKSKRDVRGLVSISPLLLGLQEGRAIWWEIMTDEDAEHRKVRKHK